MGGIRFPESLRWWGVDNRRGWWLQKERDTGSRATPTHVLRSDEEALVD